MRLTVGKRGVSVSAGTRGLRVSTGRGGTHVTTSLPGTGLSYRQRIGRRVGATIGRGRGILSEGDPRSVHARPALAVLVIVLIYVWSVFSA